MGTLKPVLYLLILGPALLCTNALATDPPPRAGAVRSEARTAPKPNTTAPAQAAPAKKPLKRRAVAARLDDGMNPPTYAPRLTPAPPVSAPPSSSSSSSSSPSPSSSSSPIPPGPVILNGCVAGHCMDQSGARYNAVGTSLISPQGRLCSNNGISVTCY